ncbi:hypothetical protein AVEN_136721-1 [Araneus ventricosus]|uniref:Uncharacterized protein n=1 Tax=Araneus ventricosus TaxID=182803 RepID=A0A4Y2EV38_ARAVE|nr:hypothetical protein AVEN_136721-1 [Araneus ventricosus]
MSLNYNTASVSEVEDGTTQESLKDAVIYYQGLLAQNNLISSESSASISHEAMLTGEENFQNTLAILAEKIIISGSAPQPIEKEIEQSLSEHMNGSTEEAVNLLQFFAVSGWHVHPEGIPEISNCPNVNGSTEEAVNVLQFFADSGWRVHQEGIPEISNCPNEEIAMDEEKENHTWESDNEIMPERNGKIRIIRDFLILSLNDGRFGERLRWINEGGKLQMLWPHKKFFKMEDRTNCRLPGVGCHERTGSCG